MWRQVSSSRPLHRPRPRKTGSVETPYRYLAGYSSLPQTTVTGMAASMAAGLFCTFAAQKSICSFCEKI